VNVWQKPDGSEGGGHNWLNAGRELRPDPSDPANPKPFYTLQDDKVLTHEAIMRSEDWQEAPRLVIGGKDET